MKKITILFLSLILIVGLSACEIKFGGNNENEEEDTTTDELAEDLENIEESTEEEDSEDEENVTEDPEEEESVEENNEETEEEPEEVVEEESTEEDDDKVMPYEGPNFITLISPDEEMTTHTEPVIFTGDVSPNTTKIVVEASYYKLGSMEPLEDVYRLQNFKYGDNSFTYRAKFEFNNLGFGTNKYKFTAYFDDGTTKSDSVTVYYVDGGAEMGKPVIYLYPEETSEIFVNVEPTNGISVSIPEIGNGWNVIATPEGEVFNLADQKTYPYLFWEGFAENFDSPKEGFVVAKDEVENFFDEKLSFIGLNEKEISDFKEFWLPKLSEDPFYFITFVPQELFDVYAPLTISPEPDTLIRVFFDYKGLDKYTEVKEQKLFQTSREGFTVIEWGGRLY